jgi:hypothetical protein
MPWRLRRPSEIPRDEWLARLDITQNPSPFLLPEWSLFWADAWSKTHAEVYDDGKTLIPVVHRRRHGFGWRFAQPYGTDCIMGDATSVDWPGLVTLLTRNRAVEIAISAGIKASINGWIPKHLTQNCWIIKTAGKTYTELAAGFSGSHRRNINKGEELGLRIDASFDQRAISQLIGLWQDRHRVPRFMLNPVLAPALTNRFAPIDALHWGAAWAGERPVAGTVFLVYRNTAVSVDTIVDRDPQFRGAGHYLVAQSLNSLIDSGVTHIDLGGVPGGAEHTGLDEFKSGWSATQETVHTTIFRRNWYDILRRVLDRTRARGL